MLKKYIISLSILCALGSFELNAAAFQPLGNENQGQTFFSRLNNQGKALARVVVAYALRIRQQEDGQNANDLEITDVLIEASLEEQIQGMIMPGLNRNEVEAEMIAEMTELAQQIPQQNQNQA